VVRIPVVDYRHSGQTRSVLDSDPKPIGSVVNVVGDQVRGYVPLAEHPLLALDALLEKALLPSCNFHNGTWTPVTIAKVKQQMASACIIHLTCHGRFDESFGYYLQLSTGEHPKRYRLYSSLLQSQFYLDDALVFVNACTSDVPTLHYGTFINLGHEFFESGAGSFIGTIAPVPIQRAVRLADAFYDSLLQGESVGMSLHKAKMVMKEEQNPFWLFYCLYGNALQRFAPAD
jgi:CHAT domain-containing protein